MFKRRIYIYLFSASLLLSGSISFGQDLDIFVSAHPDDWQLFMNPNAYRSLKDSTKRVIFLHTTAGDAGHGMGNNEYYLAREEGSLRAIRFMVNAIRGKKGLGQDMNSKKIRHNKHDIQRFDYGNAIAYFLRLPDGNYRGPGYTIHDSTSIQKLVEGRIKSIGTVDKSTEYRSLKDLKKTIKALINYESNAKGNIRFNLADTDTIVNPGDHSDHRYSSYLMQDLAKEMKINSIRLYQEYATSEKEMNIKDEEFLISAGTWGATASGLSDHNHYSTWDRVHNSWIGRQYFRETKPGED